MPDSHTDRHQDTGSSRALVVLAQQHSEVGERPSAGFVTQLIACNRRIGIYRTARRAEPADAITLYRGPAEAQLANFQRII
jgi:hypothetical protein